MLKTYADTFRTATRIDQPAWLMDATTDEQRQVLWRAQRRSRNRWFWRGRKGPVDDLTIE